jgi:hypothetical protein
MKSDEIKRCSMINLNSGNRNILDVCCEDTEKGEGGGGGEGKVRYREGRGWGAGRQRVK